MFYFTPFPGFFSTFPHGTIRYRKIRNILPYGVVPANSHRISRARCYSGIKKKKENFRLQDYHFLWYIFPDISSNFLSFLVDIKYLHFYPITLFLCIIALEKFRLHPISLAATPGIVFTYFSSRY